MSKIIKLLSLLVIVSGCDSKPKAAKLLSETESSKISQATRAINALPEEVPISGYRHFHVDSAEEDRIRMIENFRATVENSSIIAVSVGCNEKKSCEEVIQVSFEAMLMGHASLDGKVIVLPESVFTDLEGLVRRTRADVISYR